MKTKIIMFAFFASFWANDLFAQDRTTVTANSDEISDNLDLRAVASVFGDSENLEDFERRLNDPKLQISNLDLNRDNQVDYLRVIESVEGNTHLIIVQAVLEKDVFQDVATVEVERDANNQVQVQVVGDVYMYGTNYIYEPVYVHTPVIYNYFWVGNYHPYYSSWYWGYYPSYYYAWNPYPIYTYRRHLHAHINHHHHYNYVNVRRSQRAVALHNVRRANGYEVRHPERSFASRNTSVRNRQELQETRNTRDAASRSALTAPSRNGSTGGTRNSTSNGTVRSTNTVRNNPNGTRSVTAPSPGTRNNSTVRGTSPTGTRSVSAPNTSTRSNAPTVRNTPSTNTRSVTAPNNPRAGSTSTRSVNANGNNRAAVESPRAGSNTRVESPRVNTRSESPRVSPQPSRSSNSSARPAPSQGNSSRSAAPQGNRGGGQSRGDGSGRR